MKLRVSLLFLLVGALLLAPAVAHGDEGEETTVKGEVLDLACYVAHEAKGLEHAKCAVRCVKGGQPMGLLAEDGTLYVLFADHSDSSAYDAAKEFAGKTVQITGSIADRGGVSGITVHKVAEG